MTIAYMLRDWHSIGGIQRFAQMFCESAEALGHHTVRQWKPADVVIIGHVNLLPLAMFMWPRQRIWLVIYGIEAWKNLTLLQRIGLWRIERVIGISQFTIDHARPFIGEKPYYLLRCTC